MTTKEHFTVRSIEAAPSYESPQAEREARGEAIFTHATLELGRAAVLDQIDSYVYKDAGGHKNGNNKEVALKMDNFHGSPQALRNAEVATQFKIERAVRRSPELQQLLLAREAIAYSEVRDLPAASVGFSEDMPVTEHEVPHAELLNDK